ncbi:MAG: trypsin-like peptidase domain-containing protein [Candidatus Saccharibacteria bacterium]|nr:trypsin-like peptidase domain-containing protein [Candidatus Saccharibacteria bacterium]
MALDKKQYTVSVPKPKMPKLPRLPRLSAKGASTTLMIMASISAGFLGGWFGGRSQDRQISSSGLVTTADRQIILNESQLISDIAKTVGPSVVSVNVTSQATSMGFFGFEPQAYDQESAGTGFIITDDGVIITNRHVVPTGISTVSVTLSDGTELDDVEVLGRTSESDSLDIAFLKIKGAKGKTFTPLKLGDSAKMQVGDKVVAIGNALGQFQNTVTSGIISGYGRDLEAGGEDGSVETLQNVFQTDAAINQGNSGGPLVNINGEVIGINTAIAGGSAQNIGFAIPINDVQGLIKSVLEKGKLERPYLGIRYVSLTDDYAYEYNLNVKRGAYIVPSRSGGASILSGSPAEKAGLKEKDVITKVNDQEINEDSSLTSVLGRYSVDETVTLTIVRDGKEQTLKATLEAAPTE